MISKLLITKIARKRSKSASSQARSLWSKISPIDFGKTIGINTLEISILQLIIRLVMSLSQFKNNKRMNYPTRIIL